MSAIVETRNIESCGMEDLLRFLENLERVGQLSFVMTSNGKLAQFLQKTAGDLIINCKGRTICVEVKIERTNQWDNLFLETWSNLSRFTLGWIFTLQTDLLFYYFIAQKELLVINFENLRRWCFWGEKNIYKYDEKEQKAYNQPNNTAGRCVKIADVEQAIGIQRYRLGDIEYDASLADRFVEHLFAESVG